MGFTENQLFSEHPRVNCVFGPEICAVYKTRSFLDSIQVGNVRKRGVNSQCNHNGFGVTSAIFYPGSHRAG